MLTFVLKVLFRLGLGLGLKLLFSLGLGLLFLSPQGVEIGENFMYFFAGLFLAKSEVEVEVQKDTL